MHVHKLLKKFSADTDNSDDMDVDDISAGGINIDPVRLGKRSSYSNMTESIDSTNSVGMYLYV